MKRLAFATMTALAVGGAMFGAGAGVASAGEWTPQPHKTPQVKDNLQGLQNGRANGCGLSTGFGPGATTYTWCDNQGNVIGNNGDIPNREDVMFW